MYKRHLIINKVIVIILQTNLPIKHLVVIEFNKHKNLYIAGNIAGYALNNFFN